MKKFLTLILLTLVAIISYSQPLQDRAAAIWDFETSAIADSSGNGKTGTIIGTVNINSANGILGNYAEADGSGGDYITLNDTISTGNKFTIAGWAWIDDYDATHYFMGRYYGQNSLKSEITDGEFKYAINNNYPSSGDLITSGSWHHLAVTYDNTLGSNNIKSYLDGVLVGQHNATTSELHSNQSWQFMANGNDSYRLDGKLDQWAIWREVLDLTTIRDTLYRSGSPVYSSLWSGTISSPEPEPEEDTSYYEVYNAINISGVKYHIARNNKIYIIPENYTRTFDTTSTPDPPDPSDPPTPGDNPYDSLTAKWINYKIGSGIDFSHMIDDGDGTWALDETYRDSALFYKSSQKGFNSVRLVFKAGETTPGISSTALTNMTQSIDSCVNNGMVAIVDYHLSPTWWGSGDNPGPTSGDWEDFAENWATMAEYLADKYEPWEVVYELANEPRDEGQEDWNDEYKKAIDSIRVYDTEKLILVQPGDWGQISWLDKGEMTWTSDTLSALCIHYYKPGWVTIQNTPWPDFDGTDFTNAVWSNISPTQDIFAEDWQPALDFASDNGDIPINITEWGTTIYVDSSNRVDYAKAFTYFARQNNISLLWWDLYDYFGIYNKPSIGYGSIYGWDEPLATTIATNTSQPSLGSYDSTRVLDYSSFSSTTGWSKYENGGAVSLNVSGNDLYCNVTSTDNNYLNCRVWSPSFMAVENNLYQITITLRATSTRDVAFKQSGSMPWTYIYDLGINNTQVIKTYFMPRTSTNARIEILLGNTDTDVYIESFTVDEFEPL